MVETGFECQNIKTHDDDHHDDDYHDVDDDDDTTNNSKDMGTNATLEKLAGARWWGNIKAKLLSRKNTKANRKRAQRVSVANAHHGADDTTLHQPCTTPRTSLMNPFSASVSTSRPLPPFPALAVRPRRCTYWFESDGIPTFGRVTR